MKLKKHGKRHIDISINSSYKNGALYPIEIKKFASPGIDSIKRFKVPSLVALSELFDGLGQYKTDIGKVFVMSLFVW